MDADPRTTALAAAVLQGSKAQDIKSRVFQSLLANNFQGLPRRQTPTFYASTPIRGEASVVYAVTGVSASIMVYLFFPETKGRSLEEIDSLFSEPEAWWKVLPTRA
jgi:hypothetical protein